MSTSPDEPTDGSDASDTSDPPPAFTGEIDDNSMPLDMREKVEWPDDSDGDQADKSDDSGDQADEDPGESKP